MRTPTIEQIGMPGRHPVVFLGGWAMTIDTYRTRLDALAEHFTVYAITLPGFGGNTALPVRRSTLPDHATVIDQAIRNLHLVAPYTLLGHSTGAGIAAHLTARNPDQVTDLILITPVGHPDPVIRGTLRTLASLRTSRARNQGALNLDLPFDKNLLANLTLAINAKRTDLRTRLATIAISTPVHLILATDDTVTPPGDLVAVPGANVHLVTGGHHWFAARSQESHQLLLRILDRHLELPEPQSRSWTVRFAAWLRQLTRRAWEKN